MGKMEDTVFVASLGEGVRDFLEELRQPRRRDRGDRRAQSGERQGRHGDQRLVPLWVLSSHPARLLSHPATENRATPRGGVWLFARAAAAVVTHSSRRRGDQRFAVDRLTRAMGAIGGFGGAPGWFPCS